MKQRRSAPKQPEIDLKALTDKGYVKARLIRVEGIDDDTNLLNSLADEVFKGFYTK